MYALITRDLTTILKRKDLNADDVIPKEQLHESKPYWVEVVETVEDSSTQKYTNTTVGLNIKVDRVEDVKIITDDPFAEESRIADIKNKAQKIINAAYPEWKQRNLMAEAIYLQRNDPTNVRLDELEVIWGWIANIRTISDTAELAGTALTDIVWE